jgi:hypothetical protein
LLDGFVKEQIKNFAQNFFVDYQYHSFLYKSNEQTKTVIHPKPFALSNSLLMPAEQFVRRYFVIVHECVVQTLLRMAK